MHYGRELNDKQQSPFISGYRPKLKISPKIYHNNTCHFQLMIVDVPDSNRVHQ